MDKIKSKIIGIAGKAGSGKDTVANMINYILKNGNNGSYKDYRLTMNEKDNTTITHFADAVKDCLSIMFNITRINFDDFQYKNKYWFCINDYNFYKDKVENSVNIYVTIEDLQYKSLNDICKENKDKFVFVQLRTLMQYFGTDICRNHINEYIWINNTIRKALFIAHEHDYAIISDVRFQNEAESILELNKDDRYDGFIIIVKRDSDKQDSHESEKLQFNNITAFEINNNGSLLELYYKVYAIVQEIKK